MKRITTIIASAILVLTILTLSLLSGRPSAVQGAPPAAPTPITVSRSDSSWKYLEWYRFARVRADTRFCVEVAPYESIDFMARTEMNSGVNTTTLRSQYTNNQLWFVNGDALQSAIVTHTTTFTPLPAMGRYLCALIDVANTNTVTVWLDGVGK